MSGDGGGPVVHVGYPKTGTTTLQERFFPAIEGLNYVPSNGPRRRKELRLLMDHLLRTPDSDYLEEALVGYLAAVRRLSDDPLLLSNEGLAWPGRGAEAGRHRTAERLARLLPDARIIAVIRNQETMIRSVYNRYVQLGGYVTMADFLECKGPGIRFDPDSLLYDRMVEAYQRLFGAERVKVMTYEHLVADAEGFLKELASFLGVPDVTIPTRLGAENRSLTNPSLWLSRASNRLFLRSERNPKPVLVHVEQARKLRRVLQNRVDPLLFSRASRDLAAEDAARVARLLPHFEESNTRLAQQTGLDLAALGYPMPDRKRRDDSVTVSSGGA